MGPDSCVGFGLFLEYSYSKKIFIYYDFMDQRKKTK